MEWVGWSPGSMRPGRCVVICWQEYSRSCQDVLVFLHCHMLKRSVTVHFLL
jgi:hypothetical protein